MLTAMTERISQSMSEAVNERIRKRTQIDLEYYRQHPEEIDNRLKELDGEWPLERVFETAAPLVVLTGATLGAFRHRRWLFLSAVPSVFLILHAITGWAPPIEGLRRLGLRTYLEIDEERCALTAMRGG